MLKELAPGPRVGVDLGTGTGAIALALAHSRRDLTLFAVDASPDALVLAARNLVRHRLEERVTLVPGDLFTPLVGRVEPGALDLVVSNPPYVTEDEFADLAPEVRDHEPRMALVAGPTGIEVIVRILAEATAWLVPGGLLALEIGAGQSGPLLEILRASDAWSEVHAWPDLAGIERVILARRRVRES